MSKVILITGASGLLAPYLVASAAKYGKVVTTSRTHGDVICDLTDSDQTRMMLRQTNPDWVIHAAAMTNVDGCEDEPALAHKSNVTTVENIVSQLDKGAQLAFLSTDQVYPNNEGLHVEGTEAPVNVYGKTKLAGEKVALLHKNSIAFRANLFGHSLTKGRSSLDDFIVTSLSKKKQITVFEDVLFSPLHMTTLSELIFESLQKGLQGVFNIGCREGKSKAQFAFAVAKYLGLDAKTAKTGQSNQMENRAVRPLDLRLDVSKFEVALGKTMPSLMEEIKKL